LTFWRCALSAESWLATL